MDNLTNLLVSLNDTMTRIANSLEMIERDNQKVMPIVETYMALFKASGLNDKETVEKIGNLVKIGVDEMIEDAEAHMRAKAEEKEADDAYERYLKSYDEDEEE